MKIVMALMLPLLAAVPWARATTIHVSAAISMKESLESLCRNFEAKTGDHVDLDLGASGTLQTQIVNGADVDLFISASEKQVNALASQKMIDPVSRVIVARNALSLIIPADGAAMKGFADLKSPAVKRIAAGEPSVVPAGDYARQVLDHLKLSDAIKDKMIFGANVRQVLAYVRGGEVDAGLVYRTDAIEAGKAVKIVADADPSWCKPIEYPAVIIKTSANKAAAEAFLKYICSDAGQAELAAHGFVKGDPAP